MANQPFPYSLIYDDLEKVERYWNTIRPVTNIELLKESKWKSLTQYFEQISYHNCVMILIWNAITNRFIYVADKRGVTGYDPSLYLAENGIDFSFSNIHPQYLTAGLLMTRLAAEYLLTNRQLKQKIFINIDGKYKKINGEYFHFLQQITTLETDVEGSFFLTLSYIRDITYIKKDNTANLVICMPDKVKLWNYNFESNMLDEVQPPSSQEMKILACLEKGKTSKQIADELFLSSNTVDTHRRNLLKKTNCIDTTGLVTYAKLVGLI